MINKHIENPKSILYFVKNYIDRNKSELQKKKILDIPAGEGATSEILHEIGAEVLPFDLFPEKFKYKPLTCQFADITKEIPLENDLMDIAFCQEGIEHFTDQKEILKELNRVLKKDGLLIITTPSYSNLTSKLSYMLLESESLKRMPPNEFDDVWYSDEITKEVYHGHIFLIGIQKLRVLAALTGFRIKEIEQVRVSKGSLLLLPLIYPMILFSSLRAYIHCLKKDGPSDKNLRKKTYKEQLLINISLKTLISRHLFVVLQKT